MSQTGKAALKDAGSSRHDNAALGQPSAVSSQLDDLDDATLQAIIQAIQSQLARRGVKHVSFVTKKSALSTFVQPCRWNCVCYLGRTQRVRTFGKQKLILWSFTSCLGSCQPMLLVDKNVMGGHPTTAMSPLCMVHAGCFRLTFCPRNATGG